MACRLLGGAAHGAEHSAGEFVAGEGLEDVTLTCVYGHVGRASGYDGGGVACDVPLFAEQGYGDESSGECRQDDFGAFYYDEGFVGMQAVAELCVGEAGKHGKPGGGDVGDAAEVHG